jgi:hypothetical protein
MFVDIITAGSTNGSRKWMVLAQPSHLLVQQWNSVRWRNRSRMFVRGGRPRLPRLFRGRQTFRLPHSGPGTWGVCRAHGDRSAIVDLHQTKDPLSSLRTGPDTKARVVRSSTRCGLHRSRISPEQRTLEYSLKITLSGLRLSGPITYSFCRAVII